MAIVYQEDWAVKVQERLDEPCKWKGICRVEYTNSRVLHNPYTTDASVAVLTPYSAYTPAAVELNDEYVTIDTHAVVPQIIDRADLAQSTYLKQMELATSQAQLLNEELESKLYAQHAQFTDFDNTKIGGGAGNITVTASNIDDVIRGVKREIRKAKGGKLLARYGGFIVWRPEDFELLEAFMQANGVNTADAALKDGAEDGVNYMGLTHYSSNLLTSGHLFGGVKNLAHLGILKDTYGQIMVNEKDPGNVSGVSIVSRVDYKLKVWTKVKPVLFDILVA
jgi:hypothetical protein